MKCVYPKTTGCLCARMSAGFNGQDAMNDMLVVMQITREGGIAATLDASYYKGPGARNGKEREFLAVEVEPVVYPGVGITSPTNGNNPQPGDPSCALTNDSRNYLMQDGKPQRKYIVRRLTPTECARLQGFPDEWCEGLGGSDSAIYKAYGNGLALPCAYDVMNRIARFVEHEKED